MHIQHVSSFRYLGVTISVETCTSSTCPPSGTWESHSLLKRAHPARILLQVSGSHNLCWSVPIQHMSSFRYLGVTISVGACTSSTCPPSGTCESRSLLEHAHPARVLLPVPGSHDLCWSVHIQHVSSFRYLGVTISVGVCTSSTCPSGTWDS